MSTDLYYFSATGNSLWVTRELSDRLENSNVLSIPRAMQDGSVIKGDVIGIICPIFMHNVPHLVADFIRNISTANYLFIVLTGAGSAGSGIKNVEKLCKTNNLKVSSIFNIPMPSNYIPYGITPEEKQKPLIAQAQKEIGRIAETVHNRQMQTDSSNSSFWSTYINPGILYRLGYPRIPNFDNQFVADDNCNNCGICSKVCPVHNITLDNGRPVWNHSCQFCYACVSWCPQHAIQAGKSTIGKPRYHHPDVTVQDIIDSAGKY